MSTRRDRSVAEPPLALDAVQQLFRYGPLRRFFGEPLEPLLNSPLGLLRFSLARLGHT